jgi:hypothetical protein
MPIQFPVNPDLRTYIVALALSLGSGLLFGLVPIRQILRADPWQTIRSGMSGTLEMRRFTLRDLLLVAQIAICAVLVTSSLVAVRGLMRSLHSNFGFKPENAMLVETDLQMSGYDKDNWGAMQRRRLHGYSAARYGRQRLGSFCGQCDRLPPHQRHRRLDDLPDFAGLFGRRRHSAPGRQKLDLGRRKRRAFRPTDQPAIRRQGLWLGPEGSWRAHQVLGRRAAR